MIPSLLDQLPISLSLIMSPTTTYCITQCVKNELETKNSINFSSYLEHIATQEAIGNFLAYRRQ